MRIGVYLPNLDPKAGGGFTFQDDLIRALEVRDSVHEFYVFYYGKGFEADTSIKYIPLKRDKKIKNTLWSKVRRKFFSSQGKNRNKEESNFTRSVKEYRIDLMWYITAAYEKVDLPYIYVLWDLEHRFHPFFPELSNDREWERRDKLYSNILPKATYVITGTEAGKDEIFRYYNVDDDRIKKIPFATPQYALEGYDACLKNDVYSEPYLFYPAQFWPHKNHVRLIEAIRELKDYYGLVFQLKLTGADKGNLSYIKKVAIELDIIEQVHFLGFVSQEEMVDLYKNAFALTFASLCGPDNLPPLEAFALGCPVIAHRAAGADEQFGDSAYLIDASDKKQITEAVIDLWNDRNKRNEYIEKGLTRATSWNASQYIDETVKLMDEFQKYRKCWGEHPFILKK